MPEFLPFVGTRYDNTRVELALVIAPPYDVISTEYRDVLYDRDPHNVIRLELNRDADPYASAARYFEQWKKEGILKQDDAAAFYVYYQTFHTPEGIQVTRQGVLGRLKLTPYSEKQVLPHERTLAGPKKDRMKLMEATRANLSPIFGLISDPSFVFDQTLELATVHPALADIEEVLPNGGSVRHLLWKLDDDMAVDRIVRLVGRDSVIIADGHHRYETAVRFSEDHPEIQGSDHIMIFLTNLRSEGAVILPTHRLLHGVADFDQYRLLDRLKERYELIPFHSREEAVAELERDSQSFTLLEFSDDPRWVLVRDQGIEEHRPQATVDRIPAMRIQEEILKPIVGLSQQAIDEKTNLLYPHTLKELDEMRESQPTNVAFILRSVTPSELASVVEAGEYMPQKSTYFYPKLLTGLVFHEFDRQ